MEIINYTWRHLLKANKIKRGRAISLIKNTTGASDNDTNTLVPSLVEWNWRRAKMVREEVHDDILVHILEKRSVEKAVHFKVIQALNIRNCFFGRKSLRTQQGISPIQQPLESLVILSHYPVCP